MTNLKPGDPVHVEFDGTIHSAAGTFVAVTKEAGTTTYTVPWSAVTLIEPPRPEWADRDGTVVLIDNGQQAAQRCFHQGDSWVKAGSSTRYTHDELVAFHGPLTLLRDPAADHE